MKLWRPWKTWLAAVVVLACGWSAVAQTITPLRRARLQTDMDGGGYSITNVILELKSLEQAGATHGQALVWDEDFLSFRPGAAIGGGGGGPGAILLAGRNIEFSWNGTETWINGLLDPAAITNRDTRPVYLRTGLQLEDDAFLLALGPAYFAAQVYYGWGLQSYFDQGGSLFASRDGGFTIGGSGSHRPESLFARSHVEAGTILARSNIVGNLALATNLPLAGLSTNGASLDYTPTFTGSNIAWLPKPSLTGAVDQVTSTNIANTVFTQRLPYSPQYGSGTLTNVDSIWPTLTYIVDWGTMDTSVKQDATPWGDEWGVIDPASKMDAFNLGYLTNWAKVPTNDLVGIALNRLAQSGALLGQVAMWSGSNWAPGDILAGGTNTTGVDRSTVTNIARALDQFPTNALWLLGKLDSTPQLLSLATTWRSNLVTWTPQLDGWSGIWESNKQDRIPFALIDSNANLKGWHDISPSSKQDAFLNKNANTFFAGPSSGGPGLPDFRTIAEADLPLQLPASRLYGLLPNATLPGTLYWWSLIGTATKLNTVAGVAQELQVAGTAPGGTPLIVRDVYNQSGTQIQVWTSGATTVARMYKDGLNLPTLTANRVLYLDGTNNVKTSSATVAQLEGWEARIAGLENGAAGGLQTWTGTGLAANGSNHIIGVVTVPNLSSVSGRLSFSAALNAGAGSYVFANANCMVYGSRHDGTTVSYTAPDEGNASLEGFTFDVAVNAQSNLVIRVGRPGTTETFNVRAQGYINVTTAP